MKRLVAVGLPHHIIQRGNRRQVVFFNDEDKKYYLDILRVSCNKYGVNIWAWCLMDNHVHFIAVPETKESLKSCFSETHVKYTRRINFREGWRGHLWQGRFGSSVLNDIYMITCARYIERNPVRAKVVKLPWIYNWSSAAYHVGDKAMDPLVKGDHILRERIVDWKSFLLEQDEDRFLKSIRRDSLSWNDLPKKFSGDSIHINCTVFFFLVFFALKYEKFGVHIF